jgi:hypothetical protein
MTPFERAARREMVKGGIGPEDWPHVSVVKVHANGGVAQ